MCNCTDRLSALPDDVLCHILSYIPTTECSVRTSILAKRWRFLWANVPLLDFEWVMGPYGTANSKIINHVLLHHKSNITTFRLFYTDNDSDDYEFESWIATIIARNIRTLKLELFSQFKLPRCLFICKTLVDLSLTRCGVIPMGGTVYFPALKRLSLAGVGYDPDDESLPHLLSGCPVLEELSIHADNCVPWWCLSLPKLIKLKLKLTGSLAPHCYNNNKEENGSLIEADVNFNGPWEDDDKEDGSSVMDFLGMLSNVKFLKLTICGGMGDIPDSCFSKLSIIEFHNLIKLNVVGGDWWFIISLLENANHLRVLTITYLQEIDDSTKGLTIPKQVPQCLMTHLETVNIKTDMLWRSTIEFDVAKYFLENAKVLKRMEVCVYDCFRKKKIKKIITRLSLLRRRSQACDFDWYYSGRR